MMKRGLQTSNIKHAINVQGALCNVRYHSVASNSPRDADGKYRKKCYHCGKYGHIADACTNERTCLNCYQPGHKARECNNESLCRMCMKPGHKSRGIFYT